MTDGVPTKPRIVDLEAREAAVRGRGHNIVVTAGAGTGKTSLLIERVLHLVLEFDIPLARLAAITFTDKAAAEMRERLDMALEAVLGGATESDEAIRVVARLEEAGVAREHIIQRARAAIEQLDDATITTIHSFAGDLLRRHPAEARVDPDFQVDEGPRGEEIFGEVWRETLRGVFEKEGQFEQAWRALLDRFSIVDIESMAVRLCSFKFAPEVFDDAVVAEQNQLIRVRIEENLKEVKRLKDLTQGLDGVNPNFAPQLTILEEVCATFLDDVKLPTEERLEDLGLAKTCGVGTTADLAEKDKKSATTSMNALIKDTRELCKVDLELARDVARALGPIVGKFRREYVRQGWVSYDALIVLARNLLRDHPEARLEESRRFDHLLIDEFQDTDPLQYEVAFFLAEQPGPSPVRDAFTARLVPGKLFIVGDPKQSIYRFRGADIQVFHEAIEALGRQAGEAHSLRTNFRSVPELVEPLNRLFDASFNASTDASTRNAYDPGYEALTSAKPEAGEPRIEVWSVGKSDTRAPERRRQEAEAIAGWISESVRSNRRSPGEIAVLLRALTNVDYLLRALRRRDIPYVVEGGQEFYNRHEIELLLAFLRVVTNPADSVSFVTWLRSPVAGVPDAELQKYARVMRAANNGRLRDETWSTLIEPDETEFPALAPAFRLLRDFAGKYSGAPLDVAARAALSETSLELAMAASYEGAQRVANLNKAVRRIADLARDGRLSSNEILDRMEGDGAFRSPEGDSPLADETVDAVRVLSVHKSKGLEWPVVILPDVAAESNKGQERDAVVVDVYARRSLVVKSKRHQSPAYARYKGENRAHEQAESRRLFYVATTRAREELVLVVGAPGRGTQPPWLEALAAWGYRLKSGDAFPKEEQFDAGSVRHLVLPKIREEQGGDVSSGIDEELLEAVRACSVAREAAAKAGDPFHFPGSESNENDWDPADPQRPRDGVRSVDRNLARAIGDVVHLLLEVWDRKDEGWIFDHIDAAARVIAHRENFVEGDLVRAVRGVLTNARDDGRLRELVDLQVLGREVPVLYRDGDGKLWEGKIDLLAGDVDDPEVVDYKTSRVVSERELEDRYRGQVSRYAEGVQRALRRDRHVQARLVHLPPEDGE